MNKNRNINFKDYSKILENDLTVLAELCRNPKQWEELMTYLDTVTYTDSEQIERLHIEKDLALDNRDLARYIVLNAFEGCLKKMYVKLNRGK